MLAVRAAGTDAHGSPPSISMTRSERIAAHIAKRICANTRKSWASLHADALQEINMNDINSNLNTQSSAVPAPAAKQVDYKDLKSGKDYRGQANEVTMPPQPAPRAETNDGDEGVGA
jgi:ribosomal protein L12E/L44/L45/RPP1/RPP2